MDPIDRPEEAPPEAPAGPAVLREEPLYDVEELAVETGLSVQRVRRLWRALGFPEPGAERAFTQTDADAIARIGRAVDGGLIDVDLTVATTRAVGQTMARLADWEVGALVHHIEDSGPDGEGAGAMAGSAARLVADFNEPFEELILYTWRRHLAAAVARIEMLGATTEDLHSTEVTVGFADIVSFTALSNQISREKVGDLVELFESRCADVVALQRGRVIKSIGDSVLFVNDDAIHAYDTAEGIINVIGRDPRMPDVRVGLASGSVVLRLGDVFGPPVNLAARLTQVARRNRIIVDAATADRLPSDQFETRRLPARPVRGFGLLEPLAVRRH